MKHYVFVIDGEVAGQMPMPDLPFESESYNKFCAIMESNPTIVPMDGPVEEGSTWDGQNFTAPA